MSVALIIGLTLGTTTLFTLLVMLAIYLRRRHEIRHEAKLFLLPPPVQPLSPYLSAASTGPPVQTRSTDLSLSTTQAQNIPLMPHITSPSTGPNSPLESPIVRTATLHRLKNVSSRSGFSVVRLDENAVSRPQSAVVRDSMPLYPGHVPWQPLRSYGG